MAEYAITKNRYRYHGRDVFARVILRDGYVAAFVDTFRTNSRTRDALTTQVRLYPSGEVTTTRVDLRYGRGWDRARRTAHDAAEAERQADLAAEEQLRRFERDDIYREARAAGLSDPEAWVRAVLTVGINPKG